jgi:hypothetical protein
MITMQLDSILQSEISNRFDHPNPAIRNASWIARLNRNAFAHDPLQPTWQLYPECEKKIFEVEKIVALNTDGLHGKPVRRIDYDGPLALLRLSAFVREQVLMKQPANPTVVADARQAARGTP